MKYQRMPIEAESPEEKGYGNIRYNLAESSVRDISLNELGIDWNQQILFYGEHRGAKLLREMIVWDEKEVSTENVLVTPSAATALFILHTTLLQPGDHLIVLRPNYATNLETPRAIGADISFIDLKLEDNFEVDLDEVRKLLKPTTKLISITTPHNPTGKVYDQATINTLIEMAEKQDCRLLVDETYRDLNFQTTTNPYAASLSKQVISVCSLSKAYGAPGIRIGWMITKDTTLLEKCLAAKEQIIICNSVVDEAIAVAILQQKKQLLAHFHQHISNNFSILKQWMFQNQELLDWMPPQAGVVCFPLIKSNDNFDATVFHQNLFERYQTIVGPGHWFEQSNRYLRIGFGYPTAVELQQGLQNILEVLKG